MTIKQFYEKKANDEFDNDLYEKAADEAKNARTDTFLVLVVLFGCLTVFSAVGIVFGILDKNNTSLAFFCFTTIICIILGVAFFLANLSNKKKIVSKEFIQSIYVKMFIEKEIGHSIPDHFLYMQYDKQILDFNVTNEYHFKKLSFYYSADTDSICIFTGVEYFKPILIKNIVEYDLLDENRVVCSCKKGDIQSTRNFIYNKFECERLELKLYVSDNNGGVYTKEYKLLSDKDRDDKEYIELVDFLKRIFDRIDSSLLKFEEKKVIKEELLRNNQKIYDKLVQLKKLYDDGIIDQTTYEEKKKKYVEEL